MKQTTVKTPGEIFAVIGKSGVVRIRNSRQMAIRAARQVIFENAATDLLNKQFVIQKYVRDGEPEIAKRK